MNRPYKIKDRRVWEAAPYKGKGRRAHNMRPYKGKGMGRDKILNII